MKKPILFLCAVLFVLVPRVDAQTTVAPRRPLGRPVTEVYRVDPGISITINYDAQGQVCDEQLAGDYLSVQKFADKLVPVKSRGRRIGPPVGLVAMNCCQSFAYEYEKVTMITSMGLGQPPIRFVFKGKECVVKQPVIQGRPQFWPSVITPAQPSVRREPSPGNENRIYRKYEITQPAVILELPAPELTSQAIANPEPGEMIIEAVLEPSGEVRNIVQRGNLKNGMTGKAIVAARKIKFKPALLDDKPVAQRAFIKYSVKKCDGDRICTRAEEVLEP